MKRHTHVTLLAVALTTLAAVVQGQVSRTPKAGGIVPKVALAYVTNNPSDYWVLCRKGTEAAAKELGNVTVQFIMPADGAPATQKQEVDELLSERVKGIAICPVDPYNQTPYLNGVAAKTNLITSDSDAPASRRLCFIGTDNHAAGLQAGRLIKQALPQGGQIMLFVGIRAAKSAQEREMGIRDALRGSHISVVGVREDNTDHALAVSNVSETLARYPHIAGMVGLWSYNGPAIVNAVQAMHKVNKVKIVCFDEDSATMSGIQAGAIYATVTQQPYQMGYQSVKLLAALAKGNKSRIPPNKCLVVPTVAVKKGNLKAYESTRARLLGEM